MWWRKKKKHKYQTVKEYLDKQKLTRWDLVHNLGISYNYAGKIYNGTRTPPKWMAWKLLDDYGIPMEISIPKKKVRRFYRRTKV